MFSLDEIEPGKRNEVTEVALVALGFIERLVAVHVEAATVVTVLKVVFSTLSAYREGKVTASQVRDEIVRLDDAVSGPEKLNGDLTSKFTTSKRED